MTDRDKKEDRAFWVGLLFIVAGFFFLNGEVKEETPHALHIYIFAGLSAIGAILVSPDRLTAGIRGAVVPILALLPWTKTARESKAVKAIPADAETLTPES